ncbi:hypothetical protein C1N53_08110 [Pontibacter sp. SGAir0037]|nr:hypothetical protein C1N53_08110 [Pontibacter sp. SGAir0037]
MWILAKNKFNKYKLLLIYNFPFDKAGYFVVCVVLYVGTSISEEVIIFTKATIIKTIGPHQSCFLNAGKENNTFYL